MWSRYQFARRHRKLLSLDNPSTISDLINRYKVTVANNYRYYAMYADKNSLKKIAETRWPEVKTVKTLNTFSDMTDLCVGLYSGKVALGSILKLSNDCGSVIVYNGDNQKTIDHFSKKMAEQKGWALRNGEYQYLNRSHILNEMNISSGKIFDCKFWMSKGEFVMLQMNYGEKVAFLDEECKDFGLKLQIASKIGCHPTIGKPQNLLGTIDIELLKKMAKKISSEFEFVRVDFMCNAKSGKCYLNELTFHPSSGLKLFLSNQVQEKIYSKLWRLHANK